MAAYIIVEVEIHDPQLYEEYKKMTPGSLEKYEGRFIVRGAQTTSLEGDWTPQRMVVLEFPSVEKAKAWWASEEYAPGKAIRQRAATTKMLVVDGYN